MACGLCGSNVNMYNVISHGVEAKRTVRQHAGEVECDHSGFDLLQSPGPRKQLLFGGGQGAYARVLKHIICF